MHRILFLDGTCPRPYDGNTLRTVPQGGSESSLTRVAEALARRGHRVRVMQRSRAGRADVDGVEYTARDPDGDFDPTHVVAFRNARLLDHARGAWPRARGFAWYQDFPSPGGPFLLQAGALARNRATAVLVSDWHQRLWIDYLRAYGLDGRVATRRIYNPIPDDLRPDGTPVDRDKLVFFSSPHKGLDETLRFFSGLRERPGLEDLRLCVANPGYRTSSLPLHERWLVDLGPLPWERVIGEVRSAFLVLHCNRVYPETFGLVHAEADAVGTPWISGSLGANPEICAHPDEIADLDDLERVADRIVQWRTRGRPAVRAGERFRISRVAGEWDDLLGAGAVDGGAPRHPDLPPSADGGEAGGGSALLVYDVDRADVAAGDTSGAEAFFARLEESPAAHQGRVDLRFAGHPGDPREPWEVPEVRAWLRALDERVPSWFWYLAARPASDGLLAVMLALCAHSRAGAGGFSVEPDARASFLEAHFDRFRQAAERAGFRSAQTVRITQEVARYYGARLAPPGPR